MHSATHGTSVAEVQLHTQFPVHVLQEDEDTSYGLDLSHNRRATVSEYKAEWRVDLREYYEVLVLLNALRQIAACNAELSHINICSWKNTLTGCELWAS